MATMFRAVQLTVPAPTAVAAPAGVAPIAPLAPVFAPWGAAQLAKSPFAHPLAKSPLAKSPLAKSPFAQPLAKSPYGAFPEATFGKTGFTVPATTIVTGPSVI